MQPGELRRHVGLAVRGQPGIVLPAVERHQRQVVRERGVFQQRDRERQITVQRVPALRGDIAQRYPRCREGGEPPIHRLGQDRGERVGLIDLRRRIHSVVTSRCAQSQPQCATDTRAAQLRARHHWPRGRKQRR